MNAIFRRSTPGVGIGMAKTRLVDQIALSSKYNNPFQNKAHSMDRRCKENSTEVGLEDLFGLASKHIKQTKSYYN